jgi:hypothetical protein
MRRPRTGIALCFAGAALMMGAMLTKAWWVADHGDESMRVGLSTVEACYGGQCDSARLRDELGPGHGTFFLFIALTRFGAYTAGVIIAVAAGLALRRRELDWPIQPTSIGIVGSLFTLASACVLMVLKPDELSGEGVNPGYSFLMCGVGATCGMLGSIWLGRSSLGHGDPTPEE